MGAPIDLTGGKFGRLRAVRLLPERKNRARVWECICDCGRTIATEAGHLRKGHTTSCGCVKNVRHGFASTRVYRIWAYMIQRCENKNATGFKHYGARGVAIHPEWKDAAVFCKWAMENGYSDNAELDRIDNEGPYSPENCRWVSHQENNQNTRRTKLDAVKVKAARLAFQAGIMNKTEIAAFFGVSRTCVVNAVNKTTWSNV